MFGYIRKHKEAKRLLHKGEDLLTKAQYTSLEEWEYETFCRDAASHAAICLKSTLPIDSALLYTHIFLLTCLHSGEDPRENRDALLQIAAKLVVDHNYHHKAQTVYKEIVKHYHKLI